VAAPLLWVRGNPSRHADARTHPPGRRLHRVSLSRKSRRRLPARRARSGGVDAGGRRGDEPLRDRLPAPLARRLRAPLVHPHHRGGPLRARHPGGGARPLGVRPAGRQPRTPASTRAAAGSPPAAWTTAGSGWTSPPTRPSRIEDRLPGWPRRWTTEPLGGLARPVRPAGRGGLGGGAPRGAPRHGSPRSDRCPRGHRHRARARAAASTSSPASSAPPSASPRIRSPGPHIAHSPPSGARALERSALTGRQISRRPGTVRTTLCGDRVMLAGEAVTVLRGTLVTPDPNRRTS
jgi:hypothetical protein